MKRILAALSLSALMALSFAACGSYNREGLGNEDGRTMTEEAGDALDRAGDALEEGIEGAAGGVNRALDRLPGSEAGRVGD